MKAETRARIRRALFEDWRTADQLADYLCLSVSNIRQQILAIGREEILFARREKRKYAPRAYRLLPRAVMVKAVTVVKASKRKAA